MFPPIAYDKRVFLAVLVALVVLAWVSLLAWGQSPNSRFLSHEALGDIGSGGMGYLSLAVFFTAAWTLMTVAMMLPTAMPLMLLFRRFISGRTDAAMLVSLVIAGYVIVWALFGAFIHLGDFGLHQAVDRIDWLAERSWVLGAAPLLVAGAYQFTPLKYICLEKCRSPFSFIVEHWHGRSARMEAFQLGVHHGVFCVGCCWSIMLLMFVLGVGNIAWMLGLGSIMAVEKNMPWGRRLSTPLGIVLLVAGLTIVAVNLSSGAACAHDGFGC